MALIINTGGTFNKIYNRISGDLIIERNCTAVEEILARCFYGNIEPKIKGIIYKDSLEMDNADRLELLNTCKESSEKEILIIHGTDTMDKSAHFLAKSTTLDDKKIVFTGAMKPYSIEPSEAAGNLAFALAFLLYGAQKNRIYIALNGIAGDFRDIIKDRIAGKFILKSSAIIAPPAQKE